MQRIDTPDGHFHAGDPSAGVKGSVVTRDYMEAVQEELAAIPESVGIKLDKGDNKQILKAIQKMLASAVGGHATSDDVQKLIAKAVEPYLPKSEADFAKKAGDAAQTFQVADATEDGHALNRRSANGLYAKKGEAGASTWDGVTGKPTTLDGYGIKGEADGRYLAKDSMAITRLQTSNVTSSVSSIDFSNLSDDYAQYIVEICDLSTDTMGAELWLRLSEGGSWRSSSYISTWAYNNQARTGAAPGNAGGDHIQILNGMHAGNGLGVAGRIVIYSPHSGSAFKRLTWDMQNHNADSGVGTVARYYGAGALESQRSIDGIRLQLSSGSIVNATVKLYGVN
ncbi:hypothetical protein [Pandoraea sp. SD6-2]|uniref:hypothetical protein n=1 Tax=Pandoraea sp. SD6-2 TaxID=1286093 RepID=UPI00032DB31D|nr:hypothetical protein [Pandoraea sp. SD6-2]EON13097.1 hypothetical protein C266_13834 [Pandoraea sp. SD6-2]